MRRVGSWLNGSAVNAWLYRRWTNDDAWAAARAGWGPTVRLAARYLRGDRPPR